jgi:hypothetical protein
MGVETILQEIDKEIANLTQARNVLLGLNGSSANGKVVTMGTGRFTAAARARMAAAQKARWAKYRAANGQTAVKDHSRTAKPVRVMSASARRKIAAAQKARWAKVRAGKKAA